MPPAHIADARTQVRLRRALVGEHTGWYQRIHAILFHHGLPERSQLLTADGRAWLARVELPPVARQAVDLALRMIDHLDTELASSTPSWPASPGPSQAAGRSWVAMGSAG
jgi:transposase